MYSMLIAKSPVKIVQSKRPINEKQMLHSWIIFISSFIFISINCCAAGVKKTASSTVRGLTHCVLVGKLTENHQTIYSTP
ncbi:hypothetical protein T4B_3721 [Trichinella pseudospiralis]|uniref:Uncharacterized protein n=1 Tax=Trichinella pseudospiralis TaxID=6337 RepID=A0A0V1K3L7_TRIPS|nr:hypothetical protein T4A_11693 [Trichinella pseudospiralis]KRZ21257.1 hypothetical protein T4B_3721 [Trichinella pseudospiralis]KRZ41827.1 hypothetical protein T4C_4135 [Trichinella pseudospiralis]